MLGPVPVTPISPTPAPSEVGIFWQPDRRIVAGERGICMEDPTLQRHTGDEGEFPTPAGDCKLQLEILRIRNDGSAQRPAASRHPPAPGPAQPPTLAASDRR